MSTSLLPDDLQTLRQLDDTLRLAYQPLDADACRRLQRAGLVRDDAGWWRITDPGRMVLTAGTSPLPSLETQATSKQGHQ